MYTKTRIPVCWTEKASEFAGLPYEIQYEKIRVKRGDSETERAVCACVYGAGAYLYDKNTLKALRHLEFTSVTDGYANIPYRTGTAVCTMQEFPASLSGGVDTICIHCNDLHEK